MSKMKKKGSGETIFIDHKGMIDSGSLSDKGIDISGYPSHDNVAFNMGKDSVDQKMKVYWHGSRSSIYGRGCTFI